MAFFKRELSPVERFESALREKQAARLKLAVSATAQKYRSCLNSIGTTYTPYPTYVLEL